MLVPKDGSVEIIYGRAINAVQKMWQGSRYNSPTSPDFWKEYSTLTQRAGKAPEDRQEDETEGYGFAGVYVICVEGRAAGAAEPFYFGRDSRIPPRETVIRMAEKLREQYTETCGGRWEIHEDMTHDDVLALQRRLRAEQRREAAKETP